MIDPHKRHRVLIANRGEIALRAVRAARALSIETVLAASSADRDSLAAREADRTVVLAGPAARDSYLNAKLLVHAATATGCDLLHPGYGFLSERAEFAALCEEEGVQFIGPTSQSIAQVGDKLSSRVLARAAGVPMISGSEKIADTQQALAIAAEIGFPIITKASAGGGGRGMVVARHAADLAASFDRASHAALEAFGDGTLFLEQFVERARHIEVQVMGDGRGTVVHFGERDCSLQRRYQKMIEEAPAAILRPEVRTRLHKAAVDLLASINYRNAGTVEFLYDEGREQFYFMEVNARIQVEHPVSEAITGVDLIQLQFQLATRQAPPLRQETIRTAGHAIEVRLLAEDPARNFAPSPGRITRWRMPEGDGVRVDTAVGEGVLVPPYYDSMIAKLIVHAPSRDQAVDRLTDALQRAEIEGIATNLRLLRAIVAHPDFRANRIDTLWLERVLLPAFTGR